MLKVADSEGDSMVWEESLSLHGPKDRKGHAATRSGAGLRRIESVKPSLCLKLLGISLAAQQFSTVSAEGICGEFGRVTKKLDLIGLISAFGIAAATRSLSYSALNDGRFYLTGHIGPGSLSVAAGLFEAAGFHLARLLALVGAGDAYDLVQLNCPTGLRYVGLKSNTECPMTNAVGASIVREHQSLWKEKERKESLRGKGLMALTGVEQPLLKRKQMGRDAKREVKVIILKLGRTEVPEGWRTKEIPVSLKASKGGALLLGWLPLFLTIGVIANCYNCKEWFVAGLILVGMLGMMVAVLGLRLCVYKYSKPQVARGAPEGDCLVLDDTDADTLHMVIGEEDCIQALFQRKIDFQASLGKYSLLLAGSMLYVYVIASVLYLPNVSTIGQIHYAIANLIGLVTDIVKASRSGKLALAKKACEQFKIVASDFFVFRNRTEAVAFVAKHAKDRSMLKSKKLLPCDGSVWQKWWEVLAKCDGEVDHSVIKKSVVAAAKQEDQKLLEILLDDMTKGLEAT